MNTERQWDNLRREIPEWFRDAKFGLFFHWGPYSVPAYKNEWYSRNMYAKKNSINKYHVEKYGKVLEINKAFPNKTNVEFIEIVDKQNIKMRVWERGAGETLACGTGACATAVACNLNGLTSRNVNIELLGGNLQIEWSSKDNHVYMTGPAVTVFEGKLEI